MDYIEVKVNGKPYQTYIDERGVQRFVPNKIVRRMLDSLQDIWMEKGDKFFEDIGLYHPLTRMNVDVHLGKISLQDKIDFYTMIDYSVDGFMDVFWDEEVEGELVVENPLWS